MILANKIIEERKKLGLSQEELAEKLSVSRQAVSKWESAQSIPDLQKIIAMSQLFSVSTDYLLKDDCEPEPAVCALETQDTNEPARKVSLQEANAYMATMREQSKVVARGVALCILSPVLLIFLCGLIESRVALSETVACALGMVALFFCIALAILFFIEYAGKTKSFSYLREEIFETAYGVTGLVKEKKATFEPTFTRFLSSGIILCVLSPLPLIVSALLSQPDALLVAMTALLLCFVATGVYMIVRVAVINSSYDVLLQEGDHSKTQKKRSESLGTASSVYWCLVTAAYLLWSFLTDDWDLSWIVWPIAGVLFAPYKALVNQLSAKGCKNS